MSEPSNDVRALIYNRVSSDPTGRAVSVSSQDVENRAFCERQDWTVVGTVTDNDRSASRYADRERDGFREVRAALAGRTAMGRVDVLVSWEASRNQRNLADYVALCGLCTDHDVLLAYKGRVYDMARGGDRFATGLDALLAEREADDIRERVMRGVRSRAAIGAPHGTVPFGYRRDYDQHTRALLGQVPDEVTAPIVRGIVARIIDGDTLYSIAADLNADGAVTPQRYKDELRGVSVDRGGWTSAKIRRLVGSRSMIGVRTHLGEPHPTPTWPPLVDPADYELAVAILADPARGVHHRGVAVAHLLSGIATCGPCGAWLRPATNRGRPVYQCAGWGDARGKGHVSRPRDPLDALATLHMVRRLSDPGLMGRLAAGRDDTTAADAAKEARTLELRLAALEDDVAEGRLSGAAFGRLEARLSGQIADARARATPRGVPAVVRDLAAPDARQRWDGLAADLPRRRAAIRALLRIVVHRSTRAAGARGFDVDSIEITDR